MNHQYSLALIAVLSLTAMMVAMFEYNHQQAKAASSSSQTVCINGKCRTEVWSSNSTSTQASQPRDQMSGIETTCINNQPCHTQISRSPTPMHEQTEDEMP